MGVTCDPEITHMKIQISDKIVVLGSDGLFEFLPNESIIEILSNFYE